MATNVQIKEGEKKKTLIDQMIILRYALDRAVFFLLFWKIGAFYLEEFSSVRWK